MSTPQAIERISLDRMFTGTSSKILKLKRLIRRLARYDCTILLYGETGTGKSTLARLIHDLSGRRDGPFIYINCGALPPTLIESILFGHERGAFSGATHLKKGLFEQADKGTVFLDELDALPIELQVKILTFVETREIVRLGSSSAAKPIRVDTRIIAATNKNLETEIEEGRFREDLYFRLNEEEITMPSLRERKSDIIPIAENILSKVGPQKKFSKDAKAILRANIWTGNIRELKNVIEKAIRRTDKSVIGGSLLKSLIKNRPSLKQSPNDRRKRIIDLLDTSQGKLTSGEISKLTNIKQRTLTDDLTLLKQNGTIGCDGQGSSTCYYFTPSREVRFCSPAGSTNAANDRVTFSLSVPTSDNASHRPGDSDGNGSSSQIGQGARGKTNLAAEALECFDWLDPQQLDVLFVTLEALPMNEIMAHFRRSHATKFRERFISPLLKKRLIRLTIPQIPRSKNQRYVTTAKGKEVLRMSNYRI